MKAKQKNKYFQTICSSEMAMNNEGRRLQSLTETERCDLSREAIRFRIQSDLENTETAN